MKKQLTIIALMLMLASVPAFSQFTFTAAPGLNLNSASFGYKIGKVVPYIGVQYCGISLKETETGTKWDYDSNSAVSYENEVKIDGKVIMPTIGVKYFAIEKNNVKGYLNASVSKPFLSAKATFNGQEAEVVSETVDNISLFGGSFGVGAEYFFDENFSVGGEFGLHFLTGKYNDEHESQYYNPNTSTYVDTEITNEVKALVMPTYTKISLNFYF